MNFNTPWRPKGARSALMLAAVVLGAAVAQPAYSQVIEAWDEMGRIGKFQNAIVGWVLDRPNTELQPGEARTIKVYYTRFVGGGTPAELWGTDWLDCQYDGDLVAARAECLFRRCAILRIDCDGQLLHLEGPLADCEEQSDALWVKTLTIIRSWRSLGRWSCKKSATADYSPETGASLVTDWGDELHIPPGAYPEPIVVGLASSFPLSDPAAVPPRMFPITEGIVLSPEGLTLQEPATVIIRYSDGEVDGTYEPSVTAYSFDPSPGAWRVVEDATTDTESNTITFDVTTFGEFGFTGRSLEGELGACCWRNDPCADLTEDECEAMGGVYLGAHTRCATVVCPDMKCPGDVDFDGSVGFNDLLAVLSMWGPCDECREDLDQDGGVGFGDLLIVLSNWGPCCIAVPPEYAIYRETYDSGDDPHSVGGADFDDDHGFDLVAANAISMDVTVYLNDGTGAFSPLAPIAVDAFAWFVNPGDLDGDTDIDLAVMARPEFENEFQLIVLRNEGGASFSRAGTFDLGQYANGRPVVADVDEDGDLDYLIPYGGADTVGILLNSGHGTFGPPTMYAVGENPWDVKAADLNGDAHPDLAVANSTSGSVSVLLNLGNGTFGPRTDYPVAGPTTTVVVADLDGDTDLDVAAAAADATGTVSVLLNTGAGVFGEHVEYLSEGNFPNQIAALDFENDGDVDLVTANRSSNDISVLLNRGDAIFARALRFAVGDFPTSVIAEAIDANGVMVPWDIDFDGDTDLAVTNRFADVLKVLRNESRGVEGCP